MSAGAPPPPGSPQGPRWDRSVEMPDGSTYDVFEFEGQTYWRGEGHWRLPPDPSAPWQADYVSQLQIPIPLRRFADQRDVDLAAGSLPPPPPPERPDWARFDRHVSMSDGSTADVFVYGDRQYWRIGEDWASYDPENPMKPIRLPRIQVPTAIRHLADRHDRESPAHDGPATPTAVGPPPPPDSPGSWSRRFINFTDSWQAIVFTIFVLAGAVLAGMWVVGFFDDDPTDPTAGPGAPPQQLGNACQTGQMASAVTVSTAGDVFEILEEGGPLFGTPWRSFGEEEWDRRYDDLYEWGPSGYAMEANLLGEPGTAVCLRMLNEADRKATLLAGRPEAEDFPNTSMQWVTVLESPAGSLVAKNRVDAPSQMVVFGRVGDDGTLLARWREGSNGTSATFTLVTVEIWVEAGRSLQAG